MIIGNHACHELAEAFPMMDAFRLSTLVDSIQTNGQREPIVLFEGKILDGRNRYAACLQAKIEPRFTDFAGDFEEALQYVVDTNLERRDLSVTERVLAEKRLDRVASLRRRMNGHNRRQAQLGLNDPADRDAVALVKKDGAPELVQALESGLIAEPAWAAEIAKLPPEQQRAEVERIRQHENRPPQRAAGKAKLATVFVVKDAENVVDSVWTERNKAEACAAGLSEELHARFVVHEFALNEVDGEVV